MARWLSQCEKCRIGPQTWRRPGFNSRCVGYAALIFGVEPSYQTISGAWLTAAGTPYVTVHRSVIATHSTRGTADTLFYLLEKEARKNFGARSVRIDTHEKNQRMQHLLARRGYTLCGTIILADTGESRLAFEKILP